VEKKNFEKKILQKKIVKNLFSKKKNFGENCMKIFVLTLVEVSSSWLNLEEKKIFLLHWVKVG